MAESAEDWRVLLRRAREVGDVAAARYRIAERWRSEPGVAAANVILRYADWIQEAAHLRVCRVAVIRSFTVEPLLPLLEVEGLCNGIRLQPWLGDFNAYTQELLDPDSGLYRFAPDATLCALQSRDLIPHLWIGDPGLRGEGAAREAGHVLGRYRELIEAYRRKSTAPLLIHNLDRPAVTAVGEVKGGTGMDAVVYAINQGLADLCRSYRDVHVIDYDGLVARSGRASWFDYAKWKQARLPVSGSHMLSLAREWSRYLLPALGMSAKVLVVDLDNTLWAGVVGEDGVEGIEVGEGQQALQAVLGQLRDMGILLAISSKNNEADALEALARNPGMSLRPEDFVAMHINWRPKVDSLRDIAHELNLGLDAMVFVDDNPVERDQVRRCLPQVSVIDLPEQAERHAQALLLSPLLGRLKVTAEDRGRLDMYRQRRERDTARAAASSLEDFYRSLRQRVEVIHPCGSQLDRCAQLTQKTNQFNLTTRRYATDRVSHMPEDPRWALLAFRVIDRYGDNGIVGLVIIEFEQDVAEIDTFLMSCRVIGRTIERAMLHVAEGVVRTRKAGRIRGRYIPTAKNAQVRDFFQDHGYRQVSSENDAILWEKDLGVDEMTPKPEWIALVSSENGPSEGA